MLKGILFDLDGTLVDSLSTTFDAFNHAILECGGKKHTPEQIMAHFGLGEGQIFARLVGDHNAQRAYDAHHEYLLKNMDQVPLHEGVEELLEKLREAGVPLSIVTGRSWATTETILKHHRLLDQFVTVIANDHVGQPKPSPEGLEMAIKRMNLKPSEVIYVGDSSMDILAARAAGMLGVAALWDWLSEKKNLESVKPHHWADKPSDVWELWLKLQSE